MAAIKRGTVLQFLAKNFTRHSINSTRYNYKTNVIHWRVEWVFPNVENKVLKFVDEKCSEHTKLTDLLEKYINSEVAPFEGSKELVYYKSVGFSGIKVLLKAEKVKGSSKKFFELDQSESLAENLSGKCIIEFPIIFVVLKDHAYNFEIVIPEDEFDYNNDNNEKVMNEKKTNEFHPLTSSNNNANSNTTLEGSQGKDSYRKRPRILMTQKIAEQKKKEIEKEVKAEKRKRPKNLLFTTGYSSEESILSDSNDEDTEKGKEKNK